MIIFILGGNVVSVSMTKKKKNEPSRDRAQIFARLFITTRVLFQSRHHRRKDCNSKLKQQTHLPTVWGDGKLNSLSLHFGD